MKLTKEEVDYLINLLKRRQFKAYRGKKFVKDANKIQIERWEREFELTKSLISKFSSGVEAIEVVERPSVNNIKKRLKAMEAAIAAMNNTLLAIHDRLAELTGKKYEKRTAS